MQWGKRVLTCVAGAAAIISMAGCGGSGNAGTSASPAPEATQTITPSTTVITSSTHSATMALVLPPARFLPDFILIVSNRLNHTRTTISTTTTPIAA